MGTSLLTCESSLSAASLGHPFDGVPDPARTVLQSHVAGGPRALMC
ncbi:hypothetical protein [Streptomyces sp. WELS2]|nr:hypothetical protein [Streptomyces sp. WELS2]